MAESKIAVASTPPSLRRRSQKPKGGLVDLDMDRCEASFLELAAESLGGESRLVGHELVALGDETAMPEHHVDRANGARWRMVKGLIQVPLGNMPGNFLDVGHGDQGQAAGLQHAPELVQGEGNIVGIKMLNVMRRPDRIHGAARHDRHVGNAGDNIGETAGLMSSRTSFHPGPRNWGGRASG